MVISSTTASKDVTPLFRQLISSSSSSSSSPTPHRNPHARPPASLKQAQLQAWKARRQAEKAWDAEAAKLRRNIDELDGFLGQVRRAYLHTGPVFPVRELEGEAPAGEAAGAGAAAVGAEEGSASGSGNGLERYGRVRSLSEEEKDEVDLHLKLVLEKSVARVKELIKAEEVRQEAQPTPESSTLSSSSLLTRLLSRPLPITSLDSIEYSSQLSQHREAITTSLGSSLKRVGEKVGAMQEARGRARLAREGKRVQVVARNGRREEEGKRTSKAIMGSTASFRALAPTSSGRLPPASSSSSSSTHLQQQQQHLQAPAPQAEEEELTPSQLQLFQSESSSLTKSLQADLSALESVTSTLSTISSLQTTLIQHLSTQNETIGALVGEAGEQRVEVKRGNEQLKKAKERNRSANRLLGALLVGSGLGLLFLHVMD
ncbi:hypothetical protein BCV69DRAFT_300687 [Microstroma glucosiphilum]|uniref:t-SNARE coiled-coil homology domain-containing protein n=1 Tax=Pseudomicrostroma glucosiphilum TaxID=1684307 RepID=A0A316U255_9BASI|nr:hypothetical protein BCV69DRAFT_300687 [Pseudomicrostroma glucosiphilum]PWN18894.1 hypothetical protein BCV69DRAFT_300687 [Pseudomicrostroma glucosiphilum]